MGYVFPEEVIEEIKAANGVYEVISEYVPLKKSGQTYRGLCPFHSEKTPSFFVHPDKQIFHCFGCGAGGNVFTFLMQYENLSFPESVKRLAAKAGINLPVPDRRDDREEGLRKGILAVNAAALGFFRQQLAGSGGEPARAYLASRGLAAEGIGRFRLGWSPREWEALREHLRRAGFADEIQAKAGLIAPRASGGYYDRFRGRVIFPIADAGGDVVAFGGRIIGGEEGPKYINSPETPLYHKGRMLYGLDLAKGKIREAGYAVVVEGYLDLISAHLAGAGNTVATMGTALTREHLRLLRRWAGKVLLLFDGDAAGMEAAKRSLELFLEEDMTVNSAPLPGGHDPDSLIRAEGPEAFRRALTASVPLMDFFIDRTAAKWLPEGIEGKARAVEEIVPLLGRIGNHIRRSEYIRKVSRVLDVREEALVAELKEKTAGRKSTAGAAHAPVGAALRCPEEEELVRAMLLDQAQARRIRDEVPLSLFRDTTCRAVAAAVYDSLERDSGKRGAAVPSLEDPEAASLAARLAAEGYGHGEREKVVADCLAKVHRARLVRETREIQEKIRQAEAAGQTEIVNDLLRIKQRIARA